MKPDPVGIPLLSPAQRAAVQHVDGLATRLQAKASARLAEVLHRAGCTRVLFDSAMECVRLHARVVIHFHPDRLSVKRIAVAQSLLQEGQYRSQFETGISSGGRSAFPGGDRDTWERTLFGGSYHTPESSIAERPKYGCLELIRYPDGPWPRFGSCYLVLRPAIVSRTTFTFSGSEQALATERVGTMSRMETVMSLLLAEIATGEGAAVPWPPFSAPTLGIENLTVPGLLQRLLQELPSPRPDPASPAPGRVLDTGVEAQVHGPVDLQRDVELLVVDPSFKGTTTGGCLEELCRRYAVPLAWHCGFRLAARDLPSEFRGPAIPRIARRIAGDGVIDAATIGAAEASLHTHPEAWTDWGTRDEVLQHLKQLWHVLVHCGTPVIQK